MKNKSYKRLIIIVCAIVILVFLFVPFEQFIFRFDTPEAAMKFDYREGVKEIVATVENGDYAKVTYVDRGRELGTKCLVRDKRGWISPIKQISIPNKFKTTYDYSFDYSIVGYYKKGKNLLIVDSYKYIGEYEVPEIELLDNVYDSIGTEFVMEEYIYDEICYRTWLGIIDKYPEDYKIYLDGEEIEI